MRSPPPESPARPWAAPLACALMFLVPSLAAAPAEPPAKAPPATWTHTLVRSEATGKIERFWVGQAAAPKGDAKLPVVYFLPGLLDTEDHWRQALEPCLSRYEFIAVCPSVGGGTWFLNSPRQPWMKWGDFLTDELRAFVEAHYPASPEKGQRGIIGISAGGNAALYHALRRPDLYGAVSVLSGAVDLRGYVGQVGLDYWIGPRAPDVLPLYEARSAVALVGKQAGPLPFDLCLDAADKDGALAQMTALRQALDAKKIVYKWNVGPGGHDWTYWKSRTPDELAWFAAAFAANRQNGRFPETPAAAAAGKLEVLKELPDVALSAGAIEKLRAAGFAETRRPIPLAGIPPLGAPLAAADPKYTEVRASASLDAGGYKPGLWLYDLSVVAGTPLPRGGTVTLGVRVNTTKGNALAEMPRVVLPFPAGAADRRAELRVRLAVEIREPDPLRGGIVCAVQPFDADGKPLGDPIVSKALPGSAAIEAWPLAPAARLDVTLTLSEKNAVPLATIHQAYLRPVAAASLSEPRP